MTKRAVILPAWTPRASRLILFTLAASLCGVLLGQEPAAKKTVKKRPPLKSPHIQAAEVSAILRRNRTPHQMYPRYARLFQGYAVTISRKRPANKAQKKHFDWLRKTYLEMSGLIVDMGKWAKVRDGIRHGTVNTHDLKKGAAPSSTGDTKPKIVIGAVPCDLFTRATREHGALLDQFDELTRKITPKKPIAATSAPQPPKK